MKQKKSRVHIHNMALTTPATTTTRAATTTTATTTTLDLHKSERELIISWVQKAVQPRADQFCVPCNKLLKFLRVSLIARALSDIEKTLETGLDYVIRDTTHRAPRHKTLFLTLEAAITFCAFLHSRKLYDKRTSERAYKCCVYIREVFNEMLDTLNVVKEVAVLDGLRGGQQLDRQKVTEAVVQYKHEHGQCSPEAIFNLLS